MRRPRRLFLPSQGGGFRVIKKILSLFAPKKKMRRVALKFVSYYEGDKLIKEGWTLPKEENTNRVLGMVFLEKLEEV